MNFRRQFGCFCASRAGVFSTVNVPVGLSVSYSNNGVFLVVTGAVPVRLIGAVCAGTNFTFAFPTVTNLNYTVEYNDDLRTTNWETAST